MARIPAFIASGSVAQASMIEANDGSIVASAPLSAPPCEESRFSSVFVAKFESLRVYLQRKDLQRQARLGFWMVLLDDRVHHLTVGLCSFGL